MCSNKMIRRITRTSSSLRGGGLGGARHRIDSHSGRTCRRRRGNDVGLTGDTVGVADRGAVPVVHNWAVELGPGRPVGPGSRSATPTVSGERSRVTPGSVTLEICPD